MGQLATKLCSRPQGALPSNIENLRNFSKEYCKVVELRGDKILEPKKDVVEDEPAENKGRQSMIKNKLPPKLKDPGSFTIPCNIEKSYCGKALYDLGASINLMPKSIFKLLGIGKVRPTTVTLQLVDRLLAYPEGNIEDVLVRVDNFIFTADFIVLDFKEDKEVQIILETTFLATGRTLIDVQKGELNMRV
ncbi:uncharacterized protein LOC105775265 [Gossypium raimondii]|uniref:uncharacterized protein LOC105775265 n=1 Tax=Gossypium raimondii TaxID=29730 RepID=UPI00227B23E7|nr:uncharacterized protein LOC105775265 [Gossypium raimondii]